MHCATVHSKHILDSSLIKEFTTQDALLSSSSLMDNQDDKQVCVFVCVCVCVFMCVPVYLCTHVLLYAFVFMHAGVYICASVCVFNACY